MAAPPASLTAAMPVGRATWTPAPSEYTFGTAHGTAVGAHTACCAGRRRRISASAVRLLRLFRNPTPTPPFQSTAGRAPTGLPSICAEPAMRTLPFTGWNAEGVPATTPLASTDGAYARASTWIVVTAV